MSGKNFASDNTVPDQSGDENPSVENLPASPGKSVFEEHKGKLAIGVAATLGVMIFYSWLEKQLAKEDPESHAQLKRLKASVRAREANLQDEDGKQREKLEENSVISQVMDCKDSTGVSATG